MRPGRPGPRGLAVRRGGLLDVHCLNRQPSCRMRQHARRLTVFAAKQFVLDAVVLEAVVLKAKGSSSIGQSPGLQNRWLGVRVPPALRVRSGQTALPANLLGEDMATQTRGEAAEKR